MDNELLSFKKYNELVEIIYQSATEPEAFQWLLDFLIENTSLHSGSLTIQDTENLQIINRLTNGVVNDEQFKSDYLSLEQHEDFWSLGLIENKMPDVFFPDHLIYDRKLFKKTNLKKLVSRYDISAATGAHWLLPNNQTIRLCLHKNKQNQLFKQGELLFLNSLSRHISRAISINQQLQSSNHKASLVDHIERNNQCVALVSLKGKVISSNIVFQTFVEKSGLSKLDGGYLYFSELNTQQAFENCLLKIKYAFSQSSVKQVLKICSQDDDSDFQCTLTPLINNNQHFDITEPAKVLLTIEPLTVRISDKYHQITSQTNLTQTEFYICMYLVKGLSIKEISQKKCRSEDTVRTQVKSIQRKLSVNSQASIVSKILTF